MPSPFGRQFKALRKGHTATKKNIDKKKRH